MFLCMWFKGDRGTEGDRGFAFFHFKVMSGCGVFTGITTSSIGSNLTAAANVDEHVEFTLGLVALFNIPPPPLWLC